MKQRTHAAHLAGCDENTPQVRGDSINRSTRQVRNAMLPGNQGGVEGSVMVVGAGIAGMQAALDLANAGYYVHLVDRAPSIGGMMAQLDKTFPTNDCAM